MTNEKIDPVKREAFEHTLGCVIRDDGEYAEMSLDLADYTEKTAHIEGVTLGFFDGDRDELRRAVASVDREWVQYFDEAPVFCGYVNGHIASFCIVETNADCLLSLDGIRIGSIGCVGTVSEYRRRGIGLRMVDLATLHLKSAGQDKSYIHYTHIDKWYSKLGYKVFARFSFKE